MQCISDAKMKQLSFKMFKTNKTFVKYRHSSLGFFNSPMERVCFLKDHDLKKIKIADVVIFM